MIKYNSKIFQTSVFLGILLVSFSGKTPNFWWMSAISQEKLLSLSVWDVVVPVFRPLLPLERLNIELFGNTWLSNNFLYGIIVGLIIYFMLSSNKVYVKWLIYPMAGLFLVVADGGVVYDAIFALSLILIIYSADKALYSSISFSSLILLGFSLALADLSRPFFFPYSIFLVVVFYFFFMGRVGEEYYISAASFVRNLFSSQKDARPKFFVLFLCKSSISILPIIVFILLTAPFHINQYKKTSSIVLSNYGGCNLSEVFTVSSEMTLDRGKLNSEVYTAECARRKDEIIKGVIDDPKILLLKGNLISRINQIFYPRLAWHGNGQFIASIRNNLQDFFYLGVIIIYALFAFFVFVNLVRLNFLAILAVSFTGYYTLIMLYAHGGAEQIRMTFPLLMFMLYYISIARGVVAQGNRMKDSPQEALE